jgi:ABC-2 type transport system ATP-binding protein
MNTHDIFRAREIADKIGIMRAGKLVSEISRREFETENLESIYLRAMSDSIETAAVA